MLSSKGQGCELSIDDGSEFLLFLPVRFDFGEFELEEALLERVVGRDLQGDGASPLEIAEPSSLLMTIRVRSSGLPASSMSRVAERTRFSEAPV